MTFYDTLERYLDRRGCGDEFYMDAAFRSSALLEELGGAGMLGEGEPDDEDYDETAGH